MKTTFQFHGSLFTLFFFFFLSNSFGQTVIWSDNFNNGCSVGCFATAWNGWTVLDNDGGTSGGDPNIWYISCAEEGVTPPGCGSSCIGDASLHIGANSVGDMGASFNETGAANATFRTAVSPTMSTVTHTGVITLSFDFIAYGSASCSDDRLQLRLSTDNGATWPAGYQYCLTSACCAGGCSGYNQGRWTTYSLALPAAFSNNPNVRVGFNWRNNGNGTGTDPSAAIDDIQLTTPIPLSVDLLSFSAEKSGSTGTNVTWNVENERSFSRYELERSYEGDNFSFLKIHTVNGNCSGDDPCTYSYKDINHTKTVYYRLKMIDEDGEFSYSSIISLNESAENANTFTLVSNYVDNDVLQVKISSKKKSSAKFVLYNIAGKAVVTENDVPIKTGFNQKNLDINKLSNGVYILKIYFENEDKVLSAKVIKS